MAEGRAQNLCVYVRGRLHGVTRKRLAALVAATGGRLAARADGRVNLMCFAHSTVATSLREGTSIDLPSKIGGDCRIISELALRRMLGLASPMPAETRTLTAAELAGQARLAGETLDWLALYDVVEPADDRFGYRDLLAAREVARLLRASLPLTAIIEAAVALRRSGRTLSDTRLSEAPWGEMLQEVAGRLARLDGQFTLPLAENFETPDELFEQAERMELEGNLVEAERLYRIAMRIDWADPVLPFNLGNVLDAKQRPAEAALAYQQALARDSKFAEAWLNLGLLKERAGELRAASECYRSAIDARPDYSDALFNLALLLTRDEQHHTALPFWERFLALDPSGKEAQQAHRLATLCRMHAETRRNSPREGSART
jgi:tetratricopeptide (TPR) repeat protein